MKSKVNQSERPVGFYLITETKIAETGVNGGSFQEMVYRLVSDQGKIFNYKIQIRTDSVANQAHASLYQWTESSGFSLIIRKGLESEYGENPVYGRAANNIASIFEKIKTDLIEISFRFSGS